MTSQLYYTRGVWPILSTTEIELVIAFGTSGVRDPL
jgi:hypothetical protein